MKMEAENSSEIYFRLHVVTFQNVVIFVVNVKTSHSTYANLYSSLVVKVLSYKPEGRGFETR
jgi:hypothetical protein